MFSRPTKPNCRLSIICCDFNAEQIGHVVRARAARRAVGFAIIVTALLLFLGILLSLRRNLGLWWAWWFRFGRIRWMLPVPCSSSARILRGPFR